MWDPSRVIATWFSFCSINPLHPRNCIYLQSDLSCLYKLNCNIFNHHERFYFSLHRPAPAIRHFFWLVVIAGTRRQAAEPGSWLRNESNIPRAPENMSHKNIITIYFHFWTLYNPIIGMFRACRANEWYQQNSHKWQTWPPLTVGLPVTWERYWASFQVTRLFHKATVSQCDHFILLHMYLLFETSPGWYKVKEVFLTPIWWGSTQLQCIYYLRRILISRPPRVFRRSCLSSFQVTWKPSHLVVQEPKWGPGKVCEYKFLWLFLNLQVYWRKLSLVATTATLWNFFYLHKANYRMISI